MTTLSARRFSTRPGADEAPAKLGKLNRDFLINLHDETFVSWKAGRNKPKTVILPVWRFCEGAREHAFPP